MLYFILLLIIAAGYLLYYFNKDYIKYFQQNIGSIKDLSITDIENKNGILLQKFILTSTNDFQLSGFIKSPSMVTKKLPSAIVLGGLFSGKDLIDFFDYDPIETPAIIITTDYPYKGNKYLKWWEVVLAVPKIRKAAFNSVSGILLTISMLESFENANKEKINLCGISFGSFFCLAAAACTNKIKSVSSMFSGGKIEKLVAVNLPYKIKVFNYLVGYLAKFLIHPFEPVQYVKYISPRPFLVIGGSNDERFPEECTQILYDNAQDPKDIIWVDMKHPEAEKSKDINDIVDLVVDWLKKRELL